MRTRFVAEILAGPRARDPIHPEAASAPLIGRARAGSFVEVEVRDGRAHPVREVAPRGSALASLVRIALDHRIDPVFDDAVRAEVDALLGDGDGPPPGTDDPTLEDLEGVPFVTIDNEGSRDLDQALHVARDGDGHRVLYALADAAYYVRPGSALFGEALRRGASYYLPGWMVPMLPRALSEGLVSLNEGVLRRAVVFDMRLDADGERIETRVTRARIRSRAKLTYDGVQAFLDEGDGHAFAARDFAPSLRAMREVGERRIQRAVERDVVHHRRRTVEVGLDGARSFVVYSGLRNDVERYNEQISLLCNVEGATKIAAASAESVMPIYRVHPAPPPERVAAFASAVEELADLHDLDPATWRWDPAGSTSLAAYLDALPTDGPDARIARAIQRQAILINVRSTFSEDADGHHGVGASLYARFSSPMREVVGVYLHAELLETEGGPVTHDPALRERVVEAANRSKDLQRRLTALANLLALDQLFERDRRMKLEARPVRVGTVMGITHGKVHVSLDDPAIDVKLYRRDLERALEAKLGLADEGLTMIERESGRTVARVGDAIALRVIQKDPRNGHWVLVPVA